MRSTLVYFVLFLTSFSCWNTAEVDCDSNSELFASYHESGNRIGAFFRDFDQSIVGAKIVWNCKLCRDAQVGAENIDLKMKVISHIFDGSNRTLTLELLDRIGSDSIIGFTTDGLDMIISTMIPGVYDAMNRVAISQFNSKDMGDGDCRDIWIGGSKRKICLSTLDSDEGVTILKLSLPLFWPLDADTNSLEFEYHDMHPHNEFSHLYFNKDLSWFAIRIIGESGAGYFCTWGVPIKADELHSKFVR